MVLCLSKKAFWLTKALGFVSPTPPLMVAMLLSTAALLHAVSAVARSRSSAPRRTRTCR